MNIGLYFGSFNPIHIGHLIIANHMVENSDLDQIWLVVTPHNPHKKKNSLLEDHLAVHLIGQLARGSHDLSGHRPEGPTTSLCVRQDIRHQSTFASSRSLRTSSGTASAPL